MKMNGAVMTVSFVASHPTFGAIPEMCRSQHRWGIGNAGQFDQWAMGTSTQLSVAG
jgi:hypothetical protein